jgi:hypothetical protein
MPRPVSDGASEIRPPPGARRLLVWSTQAAIPWAIATSSRMETAAVNLAALDVDPVQIPVITRDQVRYAKPDPDLFLAAESRRRTDVFDRFDEGAKLSSLPVPAQPVDATQALNLSAGVSNCKVSRGRSLS